MKKAKRPFTWDHKFEQLRIKLNARRRRLLRVFKASGFDHKKDRELKYWGLSEWDSNQEKIQQWGVDLSKPLKKPLTPHAYDRRVGWPVTHTKVALSRFNVWLSHRGKLPTDKHGNVVFVTWDDIKARSSVLKKRPKPGKAEIVLSKAKAKATATAPPAPPAPPTKVDPKPKRRTGRKRKRSEALVD